MRRIGSGAASTLANFGTTTTTDADGRYRLANRSAGEYLVVVPAYAVDLQAGGRTVRRVPAADPAPDGTRQAYVATFFPGTTDERAATIVIVGTTEREGADVRLVRRPVFSLTGAIARDKPAAGPVGAVNVARLDETGGSSTLDARRVDPGADGSFSVPDLPDGDYEITTGGYDGWARLRVRIAGRDPDPLRLVLSPPMQVAGRAEFIGTAAPPAMTSPQPQLSVELAPVTLVVGSSMIRVPIQRDGTFTARAAGPGPYRLRGVAPAPWIQISGMVNGLDTLDLPLTPDTTVTEAVVVFADRPTAVRVVVESAENIPVVNAGVLIFPEDARYWSARSRRLQVGMTVPGGGATFSNVPPGRYFAVTGAEITSTMVVSPWLVTQLRPRAVPFELTAGESRTVRLTR